MNPDEFATLIEAVEVLFRHGEYDTSIRLLNVASVEARRAEAARGAGR